MAAVGSDETVNLTSFLASGANDLPVAWGFLDTDARLALFNQAVERMLTAERTVTRAKAKARELVEALARN